MKLHVGFYILNGDCVQYPCGFCGISCTCTVQLTKTSQRHKGPQSDCEHYSKFSLISAAKHTACSPCTNIPVKCTSCNQVHWRYNMATHFKDRHEPSNMPEITPDEPSKVFMIGKFPKAKAKANKISTIIP